MKELKTFSGFIRKNHLVDVAKENLRLTKMMNIPLMKHPFVTSLTADQLLESVIKSMEKFFISIEDDTALKIANESLKRWEEDKIPGFSKYDIQPSDLILIYAAQKKAILKFLPFYSDDPKKIIAVMDELEDYYTEVKNNAVQMLYKIQKEMQDQLKVSGEELERSQNFLNSVIENIPNMIFVKEAKELKFVKFNKAGEELLGYSREDLIGKNDYDFFPKKEADFFTQKDKTVLKSGKLFEIEEELITTKQKGQRVLETKKIPLFDSKGVPEYLIGISNDITDRKKMQETLIHRADELANITAELTRSNEELEQFAYVASHDLQEPLRMITSYVQLLASRYKDKLDEDANDFIDFAVDGSNRMRILINSLLEYSRVNRIKPFENIEPEKLLEDVLQNLKDQIKENNAVIKIDALPDIYGDPVLIGQLFQNLIGNAIKFRRGEDPHITISCKKENNEYLFSVKDNGIGIQQEYKEKIFIIFQRLHAKEKYPGTGIGLAICKKIVERHNGKIWFESEINKGSTFYFTIKKK
jgi:PAS domain S-box-containing protein